MGNDSGELGHNLMDHHFQVGAKGVSDSHEDKYFTGRRPNGIYLPRFRNLGGKTNRKDFLRGYGYQGNGSRGSHKPSSIERFEKTVTSVAHQSVNKPNNLNICFHK